MHKSIQGKGRIVAIVLVLIGSVLISKSAAARPQDEVMINAYRCAGIAATRVWLDCYYGAAQPMRVALGLVPAPAAQIDLNRTPPVGGDEADLSARNEVMAGASRCAASMAGRQWLDCYYNAARPVRSLLGLSVPPQAAAIASSATPAPTPTPTPTPTSAPTPTPTPAHHVGVIASWLGAKDIFIQSRMSSYAAGSDGRFTVTLANGQTWEQTDMERMTHWKRPAATYLVTITGGAFGSFNMAVKGESGVFKVRRVP